MEKTKLKSLLIASTALAIISCTNTVPNNTMPSEPDNAYIFSTEELNDGYIIKKLNAWLTEPVNGQRLLKELAYGKYKYRQQLCSLLSGDADLRSRIAEVPEIEDRKTIDTAFLEFIDGCVPGPVPDFRVNSFTALEQNNPAVAMDADGDFVVTWMSIGQDGDAYGIYAQRYDKTGVPAGTEFRVNSYITSNQVNPAVAMDDNGNFVIVWSSFNQDGQNFGIFGQLYDNNGDKQGSEFQVSSFWTNTQNLSAVAMDSDGDFVVTWTSSGQDGDGTLESNVYARRYDKNGNFQSSEIRVNTFTTGTQRNPSIAMDNGGNFVITWHSGVATGTGQDGDSFGIYGQRYDSSGGTAGSEFKINTTIAGEQSFSAVATDNDGNFVVTWQSKPQDGDLFGIYGQRYDHNGDKVNGEFKINSYTTNEQKFPVVAMDAAGDFVVSWQSKLEDSDGYGVFAQRYNKNGVGQGSEFKVNLYTTSDQKSPAIAAENNGDFVLTWQSAGQDPAGTGVYGKRFNRSGQGL
jgi:hypothetical protein